MKKIDLRKVTGEKRKKRWSSLSEEEKQRIISHVSTASKAVGAVAMTDDERKAHSRKISQELKEKKENNEKTRAKYGYKSL